MIASKVISNMKVPTMTNTKRKEKVETETLQDIYGLSEVCLGTLWQTCVETHPLCNLQLVIHTYAVKNNKYE